MSWKRGRSGRKADGASPSQTLYVLLPLEWEYSRGVARGAARFVASMSHVNVIVGDRRGLDGIVRGGVGPVISMLGAADYQRSVLHSRRPVVNVSSACCDTILPAQVPVDVAVMGGDNEDILCVEMAPQLTSLDTNAERVGFEAARLVLDLVAGRPAPAGPMLIPPKGVIVRESTNALAVGSPSLARAMNVVWRRAREGVRRETAPAFLPIGEEAFL